LFGLRNLVKSFCMYLYVQFISPRNAFPHQLMLISNIGFVVGWMKSGVLRTMSAFVSALLTLCKTRNHYPDIRPGRRSFFDPEVRDNGMSDYPEGVRT